MFDISLLKPGDQIRIVDAWPADGSAHQVNPMNKFLGQTVTVYCSFPEYRCIKIQEDNERWNWYPSAIQCKIPIVNAVGVEDLI